MRISGASNQAFKITSLEKELDVDYIYAIFQNDISIFDVFIALYRKKVWFHFFDLQLLEVLEVVGENLWYIWNLEEIMSQKHVFFMQKYLFENFTLFLEI